MFVGLLIKYQYIFLYVYVRKARALICIQHLIPHFVVTLRQGL